MMLYIVGIVVFTIILLVSIILLIYFIKDEDNLAEVTTSQLIQFGKNYKKEDFENLIFEQYKNILSGITYENYSFLKDAVSDEIYNQILLTAKTNREEQKESIISDIKKEFCKLIGFETVDSLEVAKFWIRYSCKEYTKGMRKIVDENGKENIIQSVINGNQDKTITHEYILFFVRSRTQTENTLCPSCGYQSSVLMSSNCPRCDIEIVPKKMHWVFLKKISADLIRKNKEGI